MTLLTGIVPSVTPLQKLIFEGNSLMANSSAGINQWEYYLVKTVYASIRASHEVTLLNFSISGRNQTQINDSIATNITPNVREGDIIILWEGTNDMYTNGLSGAAAYANLVTYSETVRALGAQLVLCNVIARDYELDAGDLMDRIDAYNALCDANQAAICDAYVDLYAEPEFDTRADASDTDYYHTDKIHIVQGAYDIINPLITAAIETLL